MRRLLDNFGCGVLSTGEREDPNGSRDVLERYLSLVVECSINTVANHTISVVGNTDAARFGCPFEASRDVDAVAKYIIVVKNDVADMDADAEFDPGVG